MDMNEKLDQQMKALIDTAIDLQDIWLKQVSSTTSDLLADNYPKSFPDFEVFIKELQVWREKTKGSSNGG